MTVAASQTPSPANRPQQLVLLGAGLAHLHVLAHLAAQPLPGIVVTLIAPQPRPMYAGMAPGYVAGHYALEDCVVALAPLVQRSGIRWIQQGVTAVDAHKQTVQLDDGSIVHFDWLSLNADPIQDREKVDREMPGAREHALFFRPLEAFAALWPRVAQMGDARALRVVVIGADADAIELALAVRHRLPSCAVTLVCGHAPPGAKYAPALQHRLQAMLKQRKVTVLQDVAIGMKAGSVQLGCGADLACDVPLLATSAQPPLWLKDCGLALDDKGFPDVDMYRRSTSHNRVFASGATDAVRAGAALASNLAAAAAGSALKAHQPPDADLSLLSCGDRYAVGTWQTFSAQGRWVWWLKDWIDRRLVARYARPET